MTSVKKVVVRRLKAINKSEAWLARELGMPPQGLNRMLKNGNLKWYFLDRLSEALRIKKKTLVLRILRRDSLY